MPGKTWSRAQLSEILRRFPLVEVQIRLWQDIYDLVWGQKVSRLSKNTPDRGQRAINQDYGNDHTD
jgi:hypothetical protein